MSQELLKNIERFRELIAPYVLTLQAAAEKARPVIATYALEIERAREKFAPMALEIQRTARKAILVAQQWQEQKKIEVSVMAESGWFPNWYTFFYHPKAEINSLDDFMISHMDECWSEIQKKMLEFCPHRKHILESIFKLHDQENYIASIPLIFTQADGICGEEYTYFFSTDPNTKKKAADDILEKYDGGNIKLNMFSEFLLEPFKTKLQLTNGSSKSSKSFKSKGPNRHGIIHGSRKHLDYGTKVNGYKALSFLAFLIYTTKDEFKITQ